MKSYFFFLCTIALAVALTGCKGAKGDTGRDGVVGEQGMPGADGSDGAVGPQGPAGADGQIAQVVQLCLGSTTYPSVFVEVALRINGGLYAVYSANGGFMTYLPPGTYSSNAIGSRCNFRVNNDLTVAVL